MHCQVTLCDIAIWSVSMMSPPTEITENCRALKQAMVQIFIIRTDFSAL